MIAWTPSKRPAWLRNQGIGGAVSCSPSIAKGIFEVLNAILIVFYLGVPYVVAVALALAFAALAVTSYGRFGVGLWLIVATALLDALTMGQPLLRLGVTLYVADLPMALICGVAIARWTLRPDVPRRSWAWIIFAIVFFGDLVLGLAMHGTAAGVQARDDFYAVAAAGYAMTFPVGRKEVRQLMAALLSLAVALMLLCAYRWTVYYGDIRDLLPPSGTYNIDGAIRVVGSESALVVAEMLVIGLFFASLGRGAAIARGLMLFLAAAALILQHRSVWLAALIGVAASMIVGRGKGSKVQQVLTLWGLVAVAAVALMSSGALRGELGTSAERAIQGQDTVAARLSNWKSTLQLWRDAGPRAIATGREAGIDTARAVQDTQGDTVKIRFGTHNYYVAVLTSYGIVGVCAFLALCVGVLRALHARSNEGGPDSVYASAFLVMLLMQAVYYCAYNTDFIQFLIFGVAFAFAAKRHEEPVEVSSPNQSKPLGPIVL